MSIPTLDDKDDLDDVDDVDGLDAAAMRADRRRRLFDAMGGDDLDVLILGRPADVTFATGARQLWTAGIRPFGPACVVVRATGRTHLLSVSDAGVPREVAHGDLYGLSWNPANLTASLAAIPGVREARRVGTGSSSPGLARMVAAIAPDAEVVDGVPAIWAARSVRTAAELARIVAATAIAEAGLTAMVDALRPGVTERDLLAAYLERIASLGAPIPPTEGVACATPREGPVQLRRVASGRPIAEGELVVLDAGGFSEGYEGGVGRTWIAGEAAPSSEQRSLAERCRGVLDATVAACCAGTTAAALRRAWTATGEPLPSEPIAHGIGLGAEPPVIGEGIGDDTVLAASTVLAVTAWVAQEGLGGFLERDLVLVGDGGPQILSSYGRGPAGGGP